MSWQHFGEVRELLQGSAHERWERIAVLMDAGGGRNDAAARAYVRAAIERLPVHERPCRLVVSGGKGGSLGGLKEAFKSSMPHGPALRRVMRFDTFALAPLFGRCGHEDHSAPASMLWPFFEAQVCAIWTMLDEAGELDVSDMDQDLQARRRVVLDALRSDVRQWLNVVTVDEPEGHAAVAILSPDEMARRFVITIYEADRATGHGVAGLTLEDQRHTSGNYQRAVRLLGMLRIPVGIGHVYGAGIEVPDSYIAPERWKTAPGIVWPLLLGPGKLLRGLYTHADKGYPMPSGEPGGPTEWMKIEAYHK